MNKNRYYFLKRLYKNYLVVSEVDGVLSSRGIDKEILKILGDEKVNMIVVDKDGNVTRVEGECDYTLLVMKCIMTKIVMENIC
ncbi:MAG: hypothetical protein RSD29_02785 [Bacilli bacterium]